MTSFAIGLLMLINAHRADAQLPALKLDPVLTQHALVRAEYLCATHTFSHAGWMSTLFWDYGHMPDTWFGENLAMGFGTNTASSTTGNPHVIDYALFNSPDHRANMLQPLFQKVGIAQDCNITVEEFGGDAD